MSQTLDWMRLSDFMPLNPGCAHSGSSLISRSFSPAWGGDFFFEFHLVSNKAGMAGGRAAAVWVAGSGSRKQLLACAGSGLLFFCL